MVISLNLGDMMEKAGLILDELYKAFNSHYDMVRHHPYHRDWIEVVLKKDYLLTDDFKKVSEVCKKYNLEFHAISKGWLFKKIILCIYDKES